MPNSASILHAGREQPGPQRPIWRVWRKRTASQVSDGYISKKRYRTKGGEERLTFTRQVTLTDSKCRFVARKSFSAPTERKVKEKRDDFKARVQEEARRVLEAQAHPKDLAVGRLP
jgi:hypothetical protein